MNASAKTPKAQGDAARSIATAYAAAAKSLSGLELSPADRGPNARLVAALEDTGAAYRRAGSAAAKKDRSGFRKAGADIDKAEKEIAGALDGLKQAGYGLGS